ncbi:MAG: site-2 protease family protein [Melioribacteraceae bacterium]|nr:site-2 protease family protein [Melioribacteraceae bacterium]MCF8353478.1 site-2 protease family protein [Melioribacteraceae bacterium]MCF8392607.1 site-2 protease family protein [Melioribacteraceae bacterium]MCF8418521.1 site-2 protease family protein [Melioribacteraceae bacterium]
MESIEVNEKLIQFAIMLPVFFLSLAIHEFSHAYFAFRFGDNTAKSQGRLTLNPIKHIDLIGSVVMPFLAFTTGSMLIGWAKPVPVNRNNFKDPLSNDAVVSVAGPLSNLILSFLFMLLLIGVQSINPEMSLLIKILWFGVTFNVFLFLFNLLPIPPLDGSHILFDLFPGRLTAKYLNLGLYGTLILLLFIYSPLWDYFINLVFAILTIYQYLL